MRADARPLSVGFLLLQAVIGYEWLSSGLTKVVRGDFPGGLAADLRERATQSPSWYGRFLHGVVIPHAVAFGWLIQLAELAIGATLIGSAALLLVRPRLDRPALRRVAAITAAASLGGLLLAVDLALANGYGVGPIGPDSFDEGISLDVLLIAMQGVLAVTSIRLLRGSRAPVLRRIPADVGRRAA